MITLVTANELARDAQDFLQFKRAMGRPYRRAEFVLASFVRFIAQQWGEHTTVALDEAVMRWSGRIAGRKAITVSNEFGVVRQLCLYRQRRDPSGYVPEHALAPVKESVFLPYIFSAEEIRLLISAATAHKGRFIWGAMLRTLVLVCYCTGMRLGEAVRLRMVDIDLDHGLLTVEHSKGRTRILPIRADLVEELRHYIEARRRLLRKRQAPDPVAFFLRRNASPMTVRSASNVLRRLLRELGLKPPSGRAGARPYELRHAFAVHRLSEWANAGSDVQAKLPLLSAYLGHQSILGTEVYLKATPQLLELASRRFDAYWRHSPPPS